MAAFALRRPNGKFIRTINGDSFSRAVEAEVTAGRSLIGSDMTQLGKNGDPSDCKFTGGTFTNCDFTGANLRGAHMVGCTTTGATLKRVDMREMRRAMDLWGSITLTDCMLNAMASYTGVATSAGH